MKFDEQYRVVIPRHLRKMSSIEGKHIVSLMMKDENTFYFLPREHYFKGKLIGQICVEDKGRVSLRRIAEGRRKNIIFYLEDSTIYFKLVD